MGIRHEKFLACVSSNEKTPRHIIRKAARLAAHYNTTFIALYVQTPRENADRIGLATQRHLLNHFKLATELGGEVMQIASPHVWKTIVNTCRTRQITTICMGQPSFRMPASWIKINRYRKFLNAMREMNIDLIILA